MLRMAVGFAAIVAPLQLFIGDQHGLNTLKHQPMKIAAIEAHWDGYQASRSRAVRLARREGRNEPLCGDDPARRSLLLTHSWDGLFPGLKSVPPSDRPPVAPPFFAFRIMVGIGSR